MARDKRDRSKSEHLSGLLRNLEKENKHLKKQLARADKEVIKLYNITDMTEVTHIEEVTQNELCPNCRGKLNTIDFIIKVVISCKSCSFRKVIKP